MKEVPGWVDERYPGIAITKHEEEYTITHIRSGRAIVRDYKWKILAEGIFWKIAPKFDWDRTQEILQEDDILKDYLLAFDQIR